MTEPSDTLSRTMSSFSKPRATHGATRQTPLLRSRFACWDDVRGHDWDVDRQVPLVAVARRRASEKLGAPLASKQNVPAHQEADGTQSIHRALRVLRLLANSAASGMRLVDIARGARLHHSTTHRILRALEQEGIVERLINSRRYTIGSEVVWLGLGASSRFPIATAAARALDRLSEQVGDAVFLSVHSGNEFDMRGPADRQLSHTGFVDCNRLTSAARREPGRSSYPRIPFPARRTAGYRRECGSLRAT